MDRLHVVYRIVLAAAVSIVAVGCSTQGNFQSYQKVISEFQTATGQTSAATLDYIGSVNKFERDYEFRRLRENGKRKLDVRTLIRGKFMPEAIQVRVQVFTVLRDYTGMLAKLADSDATERWKASTGRLKESAETLIGTLADTKIAPKIKDLPVAAVSGPLKSLADAIGSSIINKKRSDALDGAILKAAPQINRIAELLRRDVVFVTRQRASVALLDLSKIAIEYSEAQQANDDSRRIRLLESLQDALDTRETQLARLSSLEEALNGFSGAHDALVAYAKSDKGSRSLNDLIVGITRYVNIANEIVAARKAPTKPTT